MSDEPDALVGPAPKGVTSVDIKDLFKIIKILQQRNKKLIAIIDMVDEWHVRCEDMHHSSKDQHGALNPCPIIERFNKARDDAGV